MNLSKQERRYRNKIIQELHLNKEGQRLLDIKAKGKYKKEYFSFKTQAALYKHELLRGFEIGLKKMGQTMNQVVQAFKNTFS